MTTTSERCYALGRRLAKEAASPAVPVKAPPARNALRQALLVLATRYAPPGNPARQKLDSLP